MIDPDYMDEMMDWHASMTHDTDYMDMLNESEGQRLTSFHEDIKACQVKVAVDFSEFNPSKVDHCFWIYAESKRSHHREPNSHSGKWLIFAPVDEIDVAWIKVKRLTERGELGRSSKVSTRKGNQGRDYVICVYTYDWTDKEDCMRIRETLREAGFTQLLSYKTDADTLAGRYAGTQEKKIAKYRV